MQTRAAIDSSMGVISTNFNGGEEGLLVAPLLAPAGPPLRGVIPASSLSQSADRCRQKFTQRLAERVGFEPTNTVRCYTLSRRAPSTARPPLHKPESAPTAGRVTSPRGRKGTGGDSRDQIYGTWLGGGGCGGAGNGSGTAAGISLAA